MINLVPISIEHSDFIRELAKDEKNKEFFRVYPPLAIWPENCVSGLGFSGYIIKDVESEQNVGLYTVAQINGIIGSCHIGFVIKESKERNKQFKEASALLFDYLFNYCNFNRLHGAVLEHRKGLIDLMLLVGGQIEGTSYQSTKLDGQLKNEITFSLLKGNYKGIK